MKKFVIFLLVAMLMVATVGTAAAAEVPGTSVTIPVTVSGEFANYTISINADAGLTIQNITGAGAFVISSATTAKANWASATNVTSHTIYVTVYIDPAIAPGTYYVSATVSRASKVIDVAEDTADGIADGLTATTVSASGGAITIEAPECEHKWGDWTEVKPATCTEAGQEMRECSACGEKEYREIPMVPHTWVTEWAKDETHHWHVCSVCGTPSEKEAHTWSWIVDKPANYEQEGLKHEECVICGQHGKTEKIPQWIKDPDIDDEPQTGDITPTVNFGSVVTVVLAMFCVVALVFKRRTVK